MKKLNYFICVILFIIAYASFALDTNAKPLDKFYMQRAIEIAKHNPKAPFGAVIVDNQTGKIIAEGLNASQVNPTFHGEMVAINNAAKKYSHLDWSHVTLYTTAEPCPMCQSAIIWAGISRVVFATSIDYLKQQGWNQINLSAFDVIQHASFYKGTLTGAVSADKTNVLFNKK